MARFSDLPPAALEGVVLALLAPPSSTPAPAEPLALPALLTQCGRALSDATVRVLYGQLRVVLPVLALDDDEAGSPAAAARPASERERSPSPSSPAETRSERAERARWTTVLHNHARYASAVRSLVVCPPSRPDQIPGLDEIPVGQGEDEVVLRLLRVCGRLEKFEWRGVAGWGDEVGLALLSMPSLKHLALLPPPLHASSTTTQNADLPRVGLLHALPQGLRSLAVSRLSAVGHKNLHLHLSTLPAHAPLDKLSIDSPMLDDALCEVIAGAGRGIKHLWLRTGGTKLTDRGIARILEGCIELESLTLSEVEGRLSRTTWSKVETFPETFKHLFISISDVGPHHSWVADHLAGLSALPMGSLETLSVTRVTPPFALYPIPPQGHTAPPIDDVCEPGPMPEKLLDRLLAEAVNLRVLELDFWLLSAPELARVAKALPRLERLKIALDAPFSKLLSLTTAFSHQVCLQTLHVIIPPEHIPLPSATPFNPVPLHTPSSSPVLAKGALLATPVVHATALPSPPVSTSDLPVPDETDIHPLLLEKIHDTTLPPIRDVKRFVKRVPRLRELGWVGRSGVGFWLAARDVSDDGKHGSGGRKGSAASLGSASKALNDLEFVSLALLWKDEWEEASRGPPQWLFKGARGANGGRARSDTGGTAKERKPSTTSLDETSEPGDQPSQFAMDDMLPLPAVAPASPKQTRRGGRKPSTGTSATADQVQELPASTRTGRRGSTSPKSAACSPPQPLSHGDLPAVDVARSRRSVSPTATRDKGGAGGSLTMGYSAAADDGRSSSTSPKRAKAADLNGCKTVGGAAGRAAKGQQSPQ